MNGGAEHPRPQRAWPARLAFALLVLCLHGIALGKGAVDGEIIVRLREQGEIAPLLVKHQLSLIGRFGSRPIFRLKVIGDAKVDAKVDALRREYDVKSAEPNSTYEGLEPGKNVGWAIGDPQPFAAQWAAQAIHLADAHRISTGAGIRVAVLDTGVDWQHPALAGKLLPGFDFVDFDVDPSEVGSVANRSFGHGTHVTGLVALVAPDARIMPLRILDADGVGNAWVLAEAMLHAVDPDGNPTTDDGAHVINLSVSSLAKTDLFKAVVSQVPFVDVLNTMLDATLPLTTSEYIEWGNPNEKAAYDYMKKYSPYDNVARTNYPATLVKVSLNDSQVPYWEGAKLVAKLRTMKTDNNPLLLKTNMGAGHGGSSGRYDYLREVAFDYAFMLWQMGIAE